MVASTSPITYVKVTVCLDHFAYNVQSLSITLTGFPVNSGLSYQPSNT